MEWHRVHFEAETAFVVSVGEGRLDEVPCGGFGGTDIAVLACVFWVRGYGVEGGEDGPEGVVVVLVFGCCEVEDFGGGGFGEVGG